jgi:hypothetical protein
MRNSPGVEKLVLIWGNSGRMNFMWPELRIGRLISPNAAMLSLYAAASASASYCSSEELKNQVVPVVRRGNVGIAPKRLAGLDFGMVRVF